MLALKIYINALMRCLAMKKSMIALFLVFTFAAFMLNPMAPLGSQIWPAPAVDLHPEPTGLQVGLFVLYSLIASIGFGAGLVWLFYGWRVSERIAGRYVWFFHIAVFWLVWSWWIHDILHMMVGHATAGLLALEFGFHATSIIAMIGIILILIKK